MNCQIFSSEVRSGAWGGSGTSDRLVGTLRFFCAVPTGLIEDQDRVCAGGHSCGDLIEMKLHGFGVAERENDSSAGSVLWAYRTEQIG